MTPERSRRRGRGWLLFGLLAIVAESFVWHYWRDWFFLVGGTHSIAFILAALRFGWANGYQARSADRTEEQG